MQAAQTAKISLNTRRFSRRLLELSNVFDKKEAMKFLFVRPHSVSGKTEHIFYEKIFGSHASRYLPLQYPDPNSITPEFKPVSFKNTVIELFRSSKLKNISDNEAELAMWNVIKSLVNVVTRYDNTPSGGYLFDDLAAKYATSSVKNFITNARERLEKSKTTPLVQLGKYQSGITLVAHPLRRKSALRHSVIQLYNVNTNGSAIGVTLNSYKQCEDILVREGGTTKNPFTIYMYEDSTDTGNNNGEEVQEPFPACKARGIMYSTKKTDVIDADVFSGMTIFRESLGDEIRQGKWIPVLMEKEMLLKTFRFLTLTNLESNLLKRMYWEEILHHLGGEFGEMAKLSNYYNKSFFLNTTTAPKA